MTVFPGNTYDYSPYNESTQKQLYENVYGPGKCIDGLKKHCSGVTGDDAACNDADVFCANNVEGFFDDIPQRDEYDLRELSPDPFPYSFYVDYLNTAKVQEAIGAYTNFTESSNTVGQAFSLTGDDGRELGTVKAVQSLLKRGIAVALYAGDADYNCNWLGMEKIAEMIEAPGFNKAGYVNVTTSDNEVHGQVKQSRKFSFTRVYESGHEVPFYQPVMALEMFERVIHGRDIATGKAHAGKCYRTLGSPKSTYREGNGTVQWQVIAPNITYDTKKNGPGAPWTAKSSSRKRNFKPTRV